MEVFGFQWIVFLFFCCCILLTVLCRNNCSSGPSSSLSHFIIPNKPTVIIIFTQPNTEQCGNVLYLQVSFYLCLSVGYSYSWRHHVFVFVPFLWMRYLRNTWREFPQIWHESPLGLQDDWLDYGGQRSRSLWLHRAHVFASSQQFIW